MKIIGLMGGMSWESTVGYYREVNEGIKQALGGLHSAKIAMYSVNFEPIAQLQRQHDWERSGAILADAAQRIQAAGADFLLICCNTMHQVAPQVQKAIDIPLVHIADASGQALVAAGIKKVGLLGTAFTIEQDFLKAPLQSKYGLEVVLPTDADKQTVHDIIYQELCLGQFRESSAAACLDVIHHLVDTGAEAVLLACTELGMLIPAQAPVKLFDTMVLHAQKAVELALQDH